MQSRTLGSIQRQRGYTLMEILVAVAIFATVMIVALLIYDQSNRVFKSANESAEMQQNTRVAFEKVVADLRMAGFDYKRAGTPKAGVPQPWTKDTDYTLGTYVTPASPNGHVYRNTKTGKSGSATPIWKTGTGDIVVDGTTEWQESGAPIYEQSDEQIEFAHDKAITIRGNFDYEDPTTADHGRETDLEVASLGHFPIVTTGNDEIVTYALVSRSGNPAANKDKISFFADVQYKSGKPARYTFPGGDPEKEITITGVDFTNAYPPYTLMRYTLNDKGEPVGTALADNIRSMTFAYWQDYAAKAPLTDITDTKITDFNTVGGLGAYDPNVPNAVVTQRLIRGKVRAVTATIVGMSPQPDYDYKNPADTVASNYRQYELQSTIVGRNLGLKGIPQTETDPPGPPTITNSCVGYCGVAFLTWAPAPNTGNVTYTVLYDTSVGGSFGGVLPAGTQTSYAVDLTQFDLTKTYYFRVAATNDAGTTVSEGAPLALSLKNATKPNAPSKATVTGKTDYIEISFTPGVGNASGSASCTSGTATPTFPAEIRGYRIYRSTDPAFDPEKGEGTLVVDENGTGLIGDGVGNFKYQDTKIVNCTNYYYRVAAVEWCNAQNTYNATGDAATGISAYSPVSAAAQSSASAKAKTPLNLKQDVTSACDPVANRCDPVKLNWEAVIKDVNNNDITVEQYRITRRRSDQATPSMTTTVMIPTNSSPTWTDNDKLEEHDPNPPFKSYTYEYKVYAINCQSNSSMDSDPATLVFPGSCVTGAVVVADADGPGAGTADSPMQNVKALSIVPYASKPFKEVYTSIDGAAWAQLDPPYGMDWDIQDGEVHTVAFRVTTEDCTEVFVYYVQADPADCALRTAVSSVISDPTRLRVVFANIADNDVTLDNFTINWKGQTLMLWTDVVLPSGAKLPATPALPLTQASPRTMTFTPTLATDRLIKKGETYTMFLLFTGGTISPATIGSVSADYHEGTDTTQFGCGTQLVSCSVSATTSAPAGGKVIYVDIKNTSTESMTLGGLVITWTGQSPYVWDSLTAGTTTDVPDVTSGTRSFTVSGIVIGAGDTYRATMNMKTSANNPADLDPAAVTTVWVGYTTQTSVNGTLSCKAK